MVKDKIITELLEKVSNLEFEVERIERLYETDKESWKEQMYELQQDNERLKELCDKYEEEHKTTFEEWKKGISEIEKYNNGEIHVCFEEDSDKE